MKKPDQPFLSSKKALAAFRQPGARLMVMHTAEGNCFFVLPGGAVTNNDACALIERPNVEQFDDGQFPDHPQSWRIISSG